MQFNWNLQEIVDRNFKCLVMWNQKVQVFNWLTIVILNLGFENPRYSNASFCPYTLFSCSLNHLNLGFNSQILFIVP